MSGIRAFSGRADCPPTGRSNVGVLTRSFHGALAREVLWIAGDTGGRFRGIVAAMVSGRYIAGRIAHA
jgi:hypothetical protein